MEINDKNAKAIAEALLRAKTKIYNKTDEELLSMIVGDDGEVKENASDQLLTLDASRVSRMKEEGKTMFKNGDAKATERERKKAAQALKERFSLAIDSDDYDEVVEFAQEELNKRMKAGKDITPELIKQHPEYLKLEKERVPKTDYEKAVADLDNFKKSIDREKKFYSVKGRAKQILEGMNPQLPDVPTVRDNLIGVYLQSFERYDFADDGQGGFIVIENGERKNDPHGNPITLEDLAKKHASDYFTFLKQPPKGGAGNKDQGAGNKNTDELVFTSDADYTAYMSKHQGQTKEDSEARARGLAIHRANKQAGKY